MTPMDRVAERYHNDNVFHVCVDMLQRLVLDLNMTPSEVREAAVFACVLVEEKIANPMVRITLEQLTDKGVAASLIMQEMQKQVNEARKRETCCSKAWCPNHGNVGEKAFDE